MFFKQYASGSKGNLYGVFTEGSALLIEAGLSLKDIRKALFSDNKKLSDFNACLVSHEHGDHAKGAYDLIKAGTDIYCSKGTKEEAGLDHALTVKHGCAFRIGNFKILPFNTEHDSKEPLGFLIADKIDKLLFAIDTRYLRWKFNGLTMIAVECNFGEDYINGEAEHIARVRAAHMSFENVKDLLKANDISKVREIHLLHLSDSNSNEQVFKSEIEKMTGIPVFIK